LRLSDIHAGYGKKEILHGFSLTVQAGGMVALFGANGAGKSSILKVVMGLLKPLSGLIWLDNENITSLSVSSRVAHGVSFLVQSDEIFPSLSVRENLGLAALILPSSARSQATEEALDLFPEIKARISLRAGLLSGGQRRMLALAMVLSQRPSVLLLDEPTAGIAPDRVPDILHSIREINLRLGVTTLLVEHQMDLVLQHLGCQALYLDHSKMGPPILSLAEWRQTLAQDSGKLSCVTLPEGDIAK